MNQSLVVYWTKIGTFWPLCPRESFIILGSQIVPDNNHVVLCHVIICSGQSRRYCVKLGKVDNIGSTNLIITRGSRLKQKENKWWAVFSVFRASASSLCLGSFLGVYAWGICLGCLLVVSDWGFCLESLLGGLFFGSLLCISAFGSPLSGLCYRSLFWVSTLGLCFGSLLRVSPSRLSFGSFLLLVSVLSISFGSFLCRISPLGLTFGSLLWVSVSDLCIGLLI